MKGKLKTVQSPRGDDSALVVVVNLLRIARGHRVMKRGGIHQSVRKPNRARAKRLLRHELPRW